MTNMTPKNDQNDPFGKGVGMHVYIYICCGVIIWAKFGLLRCYYLGQACFLQNTVCQKSLNINQNLAKTRAKKNDNFSHFPKHRLIKKPFCCNSPFDQKLVFFNFVFLKPKTLMLNKKLKIRKKQR